MPQLQSSARHHSPQFVPAVQRAVAVLERLSGESTGLTLSELARELRISPSSLLAILNTLAVAQYVARDAKSRRYRLAAGAQLLTGVAAGSPDLQREFALLADRLVEALNETVVLWSLIGDNVVAIAWREGRHELRWVPSPGLRRPAHATAPGRVLLTHPEPEVSTVLGRAIEVDESPEEPRLLTLAALVRRADGRGVAALAVTGPASRLGRLRDVAAREALASAAAELSRRLGYRAYSGFTREPPAATAMPPPEQRIPPEALLTSAGGLQQPELAAFLSGSWVARLACIKETGYPYVVPVWYEWDGRHFWLVSRTRTDWATCLRHNPHVSMSIDEPQPPLRRVIVEGRAEFVEDTPVEEQRALAARIAEHYLGNDRSLYWPDQLAHPHALIRITPVKMLTWRGLVSHPRYNTASQQGIA